MPATAPSAGTLVNDAEDVRGAVLVVTWTRGALQRAASRGRAARSIIALPCPGQCSVEVCGDDGNMEVEEMETSQQQHLILVIQV